MWQAGWVALLAVAGCVQVSCEDDTHVLQQQPRAYMSEVTDANSMETLDYGNNWEDNSDGSLIASKRFLTMFRNRAAPPKSEGYKRGPGFRSWGGKRTPASLRKLLYSPDKRKFSSWGGKRSEEDMLFSKKLFSKKKPTFHSWGGKRAQFYDLT